MAREAIKDFEDEAALAVAEEEKAKAQPDEGVYVHKFKKPFTHANHTVEELSFDWEMNKSELQRQLTLHGLTRENLLRSLPVSLSGDPQIAALPPLTPPF